MEAITKLNNVLYYYKCGCFTDSLISLYQFLRYLVQNFDSIA